VNALLEYSDQFRAPIWMVALRLLVVLVAAWGIGSLVVRRPIKQSDESKKIPYKSYVIFLAILGWVALFSFGMLRHLTFHSKAWDLAIFDQVIWNLANGYGWECSVRGVMDLRGDHFEPILLLFVPIYRVLPHVGWLLGAQAAALIGAGVILWATYRTRIGESAAFIFFVAFMLFPALHWLTIADFHPIALAPFFIAVGWWGRERNKLWAFLVGLIGLACCGEEAFIVAGWWCLWETIFQKGKIQIRLPYAILAILFWGGFVYLSAVYIPAYRSEGAGYFYVHRYAYLGHNVSQIATNFFTKPWLWIKHVLDGHSFALLSLYLVPLGLLPLKRPKYLALLIPTILYTLMSESLEQKSIFHQYSAMWIPFLMIALAEAILRPSANNQSTESLAVNKAIDRRLQIVLLIASILGFLAFSPLFGLSMHPELFTPESWAGEARGIISTIQPDEPVSAPSALCPHLSHRRVLLLQPKDQWPGVGTGNITMLPEFPLEG
jgi:uncharacterized membrane protein